MKDNDVPTIDIGPLYRWGGDDARRTTEQIAEACREWGFFQVVNHGLDEKLIADVWKESRRFFELPLAVKHAVSRDEDNPRGFYNQELTKNRRDMKEIFDFGHKPAVDLPDDAPDNRTQDGYNQWPDGHPTFKNTLTRYYDSCEEVVSAVLEAIALGLGIDRNYLVSSFAEHTSFVRLNHYPVLDPLSDSPQRGRRADSTGQLGVHHHTDAGAVTLLLQDDVGGLEVCKGSRWYPVKPLSGALVVNIGDIVQVWSNDKYKAPVHSVVPSSGDDRYSIVYFYNPSYRTDYEPLGALTGYEHPPRYSKINWGRFRRERQRGDYADLGTEIQISDFRSPGVD